MSRHSTAVALLIAAVFAGGCGSDDEEEKSQKDPSGKAKSEAKDAKPKRKSARAQMVKCIEDAGFKIAHDDDQDAATATNYTVAAAQGAAKKAVVVIHPNKDEAERAATKAGEERGLNVVAFGRTEFIRYAATDREAGVLANCIAEEYVH